MEDIKKLLIENKVSDLVANILLSQELTFDQIEQILNDKKFKLKSFELENIIQRIKKAKALEEKVFVVGDYDADGIMATTILIKAFNTYGIKANYYIPNRLKEGYGLNKSIVDQAKNIGASLIVTVDNGVVAYEALDYAKELNIEVIVTDHHNLDKSKAYDYDYLLHPDNLSEGFKNLAGAGLALLIAEKLLDGNNIADYYVYAAVATIADMVSVFGFNRNIIKNGLYILNKFGNKHIENLIHYRNGKIDQQLISFQIIPKINTAGRLADQVNVNKLVEYFLLDDIVEIEKTAKRITGLNQERITMTRDSFENSNSMVKYGSLNVIIDENIHEGLTGLIAGRHMNKINEPILVFTKAGDVYKGSGRSPKGYDIFALISMHKDLLVSFGGHKQACGISVQKENINDFLNMIEKSSKDLKVEKNLDPHLNINVEMLDFKSYEDFAKLEPYGVDFIKPLLKVQIVVEKSPILLAKKYLKWEITSNIELISFDNNLDLNYYKTVKEIEAYVDLSLNEYRGIKKINLIVQEFL